MISNRFYSRNRKRRAKNGAAIAEFGAAFYAFCIVIMLPLINFLSFALAYSYSFLCANGLADHVAQAISPKRAYQILDDSVENLKTDSLAHLFKISAGPAKYKLELVKSDSKGNNQVVANNLNDIKRLLMSEDGSGVLQYEVTACYSHQPLLELGAIPFINQIPVIGKETTLSFKMLRHPEHLSEHSL